MDIRMALCVQGVQIGAHPRPRSFDRDFLNSERLVADSGYCSPGHIDVDGGKQQPTAKSRCSATAAQKRLVDIVMQNLSKTVPIFTTKVPRKGFRKRVADCIRVAQALAFDNLDSAIGNCEIRYYERLH
jgi:hypothetical protein